VTFRRLPPVTRSRFGEGVITANGIGFELRLTKGA